MENKEFGKPNKNTKESDLQESRASEFRSDLEKNMEKITEKISTLQEKQKKIPENERLANIFMQGLEDNRKKFKNLIIKNEGKKVYSFNNNDFKLLASNILNLKKQIDNIEKDNKKIVSQLKEFEELKKQQVELYNVFLPKIETILGETFLKQSKLEQSN